MRDTLRKTSEKFLDGDIVTPMIIICSDPPQEETDDDMIVLQDEGGIPPPFKIKKIKTMFKVIKHLGLTMMQLILFIFFLSIRKLFSLFIKVK